MPILKTLLPTVTLSLLAGWTIHRDSPQGMLRETAEGCLSISHGFSSIYLALLGVAGGIAVAVALSAMIGSELGLMTTRRDELRRIARSCRSFAVALVLAGLLAVPIQIGFPLDVPPVGACPMT